MRYLIISVLVLLLFAAALSGCSVSRKNQSELRGLMLQDNLHLSRNRAYYSKHNQKAKKDAYRKFVKNSRNR